MAVTALPDNLTSFPWAGVASHVALSGLASQLVGYDTSKLKDNGCGQPPNGSNITGRLAKSVTLSPNGKFVTVKLRPLKSAAGNTLSAADVAWSLQRDMTLDSFVADGFNIAGFDTKHLVKIVDPSTVQLRVKKATSFTIEGLANNIANIYDSAVVKSHATPKDPWGDKWLATHVADYSGWKLESFTPGSSMILRAVPDWGFPRGNVTRLVIKAIPEPATRQQLISSGQADLALGLEYNQYKSLESTSGVRILQCRGLSRDTIQLQTQRKPTSDPKVRMAISLAINREAIIQGAYGGYGTAPTTEFLDGYDLQQPTNPYKFDPTQAKKLLAEAGYPKGTSLTLTYSPTRPGPVANRSAVLIQSMLQDVGIHTNLRRVTSASEFDTVNNSHDWQALLYANPPPFTDPAFIEYAFLGSQGPSNTGQYKNPQYDALLTQLRDTPPTETAKRLDVINKMVEIINNDNPIITLVDVANLAALRDRVQNATPLVDGQFVFTDLNVK
jgi:peptide/nickel transport system substrate-binding protein